MLKVKILVVLILFITLILSACGSGDAEATPTVSAEQIQTLAVMTFQAQLTQTALAVPTKTFTPLPTETPIVVVTFASPGGNSPGAETGTPVSSGQSSACYGLSFVSDVTIPDGTQMTPGQSFTKTWKVLNSGTCDWEPGFVWNVVGGETMDGVAVTLNQTVQPGRQFEFSVPMIAPSDKTGTLRGTWRLSDGNGKFFGDSPWVEIEVGSGATATPTETPTPSP